MIDVKDKHQCCGCTACVQRCPKQCISLKEDEEGFLYPNVEINDCIDCGLCEKVCPVINQAEPNKPLNVFAAINTNEDIRMSSSSGGIFTALAEIILDEKGVVFGARFNENWEVIHDYSETKEGLVSFRGSKYVQSRIGETYNHIEHLLKDGRKVLFSGTPCQVAALHLFLRHEYENLLTVDIICHGVPSPKLWREYLNSITSLSSIRKISMKDKSTGWRQYKITIEEESSQLSELATKNKYLLAFSQNLSLRPSCYNCPAKAGKSLSDITLGDFWGVEEILPEMDDNRGTSFICANSFKGLEIVSKLQVKKISADYTTSVPFNICLERSCQEPMKRQSFWKKFNKVGISVLSEVQPKRYNIIKRIVKQIKRYL